MITYPIQVNVACEACSARTDRVVEVPETWPDINHPHTYAAIAARDWFEGQGWRFLTLDQATRITPVQPRHRFAVDDTRPLYPICPDHPDHPDQTTIDP